MLVADSEEMQKRQILITKIKQNMWRKEEGGGEVIGRESKEDSIDKQRSKQTYSFSQFVYAPVAYNYYKPTKTQPIAVGDLLLHEDSRLNEGYSKAS